MAQNQKAYDTTTHSTLLAYQAAADLRAALLRAGFEPRRDFPMLRGDITASDEPFVTFGRFSLPVVWQLTLILFSHAESAAGTQHPNALAQNPDPQREALSESHRMRTAGLRMCAFHNSQLLSMRQRSATLQRHVAPVSFGLGYHSKE